MAAYDKAAVLNDKTGEIMLKVRIVYPTLLEAKGIKDKPDSKPKFSVTGLIPSTTNIDLLKSSLVESLKGKFGAEFAKKKGLNYPLLKTVDQERLGELADKYPLILRCSANKDYPPFIYGPNAKKYEGDGSDIYSGRWAVVSGKFYAYDNVSKGANFGLNRIQLLEHDEVIAGGRAPTAEGFEQVEVGSGSTDSVFDDKPAGDVKKSSLDDEIPF